MGAISRAIATFFSVVLFVINLLFFLFVALFGFLVCLDLIVSMLYQFAMPTSALIAAVSVFLLYRLPPWIVVFLTAFVDWRRWPIRYNRLHTILKREDEWSSADKRELLRHSLSAFTLILSLAVSSDYPTTGTWLFVGITFVFVAANALFDFEKLELRPATEGAGVYVVYRKEALTITIFTFVTAISTFIAVLAKVKPDRLGGGAGTVTCTFVLAMLALIQMIIFQCRDCGLYHWRSVADVGNRGALVLGVLDCVFLLTAAIIVFVHVDAGSGGALLAVVVVVLLCHVAYRFMSSTPTDMPHGLEEPFVMNDIRQDADRGAQDADKDAEDPAHHVVVLRRIAYTAYVVVACLVFLTSCLDGSRGEDMHALACPGTMPGVPHERFGLCDMAFPPSGLSTVDFIALTTLSYMKSYSSKTNALNVFFPKTGAVIDQTASSAEQDDNHHFIGVSYTVIRFPNRSVTVVTVRGSFTSIDWLQDLYIMSDTVAIQVGKMLLPIPFSSSVAASLVAVGGTIKFGMKSYTHDVEAAIAAVRRERPHDTVFVTGHSLGGFTANVVAARTKTRSVTMSPIGTGYTHKRYDFVRLAADEFQVSIIPEGDLVPQIDEQLGLQQYFATKCTMSNAMCHGLDNTFEVISQNCGDPLGRRLVSGDPKCP